ncbi:hypothetical protein Moror_15263 [Moniliophthora roreri MCA 2997]|uniref:Elongator complex protein 5 n=1 Tax=Moniliophthora roreri (strain MCA 2997) TaxID=1381753 RepID=V2X538_MONRO|nr:hypothetical protein Moror_15263 [Moniliophthora roreri MCA 2997]KAI3621757.1 hypothetical protein WG66_015373 [Moniliophthora roreri]
MSLRFPDLHDQRNQHFVLLQSSIAQSSLPILRSLLAKRPNQTSSKLVLFCFLHPPLNLVDEALVKSDNVVIYDFLDSIPDYNDHWKDPREQMLDVVKNDSTTLDVVIDSVDTLLSDIGSTPETYSFMVSLLSLISSRSKTSRLIVHINSPCPLTPLLCSTSFSPSLTQLTAHPHALITYLAKEYFTFPPPISAAPKFWGVFIPVSEREHETERLVFQGSGSGDTKEMIIEMILRGGSDASGRRKGVERVLEGWDLQNGCAVELSRLSSLSDLWKKKIVEEAAPDPMQNISFNLQLTPSQQEARARVPLPYVLEGRSSSQPAPSSGAILYDPDSADDIDDDDPDEDLDI